MAQIIPPYWVLFKFKVREKFPKYLAPTLVEG